MTTLRRKLVQRFEEVFSKANSEEYPFKLTDTLAEIFADAALEVFNDKPKIDLSKTDPAWAILAGEPVNNSELMFEKEAFDAFERDMNTPDNWFWFPAKTSEDPAYKVLREFVIEKYRTDHKCFEKYQTWRTQPFARGAMSNLAIKRNPENFPASWTDFLASNAMYGKPAPERTVDVDDNGAVISY